MIYHSIKWRLQAWYALMLVVVLAGFGFTAYQLDRLSRFQRVDRELQRRADLVFVALRPPGRLPREGPEPPFPGGDPGELPPPDAIPPNTRPPDPAAGPYRQPRFLARDLALFAGDTNAYYYAIFQRDGRLLAHSESAPAGLTKPVRAGAMTYNRIRATRRELVVFTPPGEAIIAGVDIAGEFGEMRRFGLLLVGAGAGVLALGLAGGWWVATRAIRPVADISATATRISSGDLSQRISTADAESELGQLATVLNSTFARLETAFAQQQQFTSDAAHELRTPVSVILTQVQSTLNKERTGPEYRETLEACQRAAQRMKRLIESLLELARFDAGQEHLQRVTFDLAAKTRECLELLQPLATERRVRISAELADAHCSGDPERLSQVVTNLLTNAVTHNRPDGEVRVTLAAADGGVVLTVADTGPGIAPEDAPHVFKRFYRAEKSRTASAGNSGLGLAICKSIVTAHGGTLDFTSAPGRGTTFTLRLPAI
jgi:two-component system, OmpR family, sensor kinase